MSTLPGVDGATKFNNIVAPSNKNTETKTSVSVFDVQDEEPAKPITINQPEVIEDAEVVEESEVIEDIKTEDIEVINEPKTQSKVNAYKLNVTAEFEKITSIVKSLYDKVFSKSTNFKPSYDETVGDLLLYLSAKLKSAKINSQFDNALSLQGYKIPEKYLANYLPYALKLSVWCEQKGYLTVTENLLYEITSLYKKCAEALGIVLYEEDIYTAFSHEIEYLYKN